MSTERNSNYHSGTILWSDRKRIFGLAISFTRYEIGNGRLYTQTGVLSSNIEELLLYRVTDISMKQRFGQKLFNTGDIILHTTGDSVPMHVLKNIKNPRAVRSMISELVEECRTKHNVIGREFYTRQAGPHPHDMANGDIFDDVRQHE